MHLPAVPPNIAGHEDSALTRAVALIADCEAVICSRIGIGAQEELRNQGIEPVEIGDFIEPAVQTYVEYRRNEKGTQ